MPDLRIATDSPRHMRQSLASGWFGDPAPGGPRRTWPHGYQAVEVIPPAHDDKTGHERGTQCRGISEEIEGIQSTPNVVRRLVRGAEKSSGIQSQPDRDLR